MEETLKYFLLCSERVGRITKTYCDLDAVTNLLDEKERDLELAARIGQSLLKQNRSLAEHNELLEEQLELAKEEIAQLRHEVSMQDDLLHFYTNTVEDSEPATATATPLRQNDSLLSLQQYVQYDALQQKLKQLEEENEKLRLEATSITTETCQYEDQEQQLMLDCVEQFSEASRQVAALSEELARKAEDSLRQQEEISHLLAQIVDLQQKCRRHSTEVEELQQHLTVAKEAEQKLCTELQDLQERYTECCGMLQEAQEEIRNLRNRSLPNSTVHRYGLPSLVPLDSLAAELKGITRKGADSTSSDYKSYLRVFETVKVVNQAAKAKSRAESPQNLPSSKLPSAGPSAACSRVSTPRTSYYGSDSASLGLETLESASGGEEKQRGAPGTPGRHDLEAALQRLSACQASHQAEGSFFETEREAKLSRLAGDAESSSGFLTPNESLLSTGTNYSGSSGHSGGSSFSLSSLPDKLRIIKPLEGSVTLHHWQQLAKPNLGGILDPRPGVLTKDFRQLDVDLEEVYNLHDLEEDDVDLSAVQALATSTPSKAKGCSSVLQSINNLPQTPSTFTITTCHMLHPSQEITTVTPSLYNTVVPSCGPFEWLSAPSPLRQMPEPAPEPPLRLIPLLQKQGISASVQAGSPGREQGDSLWHRLLGGLAQPFPGVPRLQEGGSIGSQPQSNIFSLNLVEKLKRLRLDKVVARGAASFQSAGEGPGPAALPVRTPRP
ncbi:huntingtin-associated protein 1 isoform X2 [Carettochelys insculpta]|uniref:huntingtin-associated protein 1 isoform X2 n=1 Tax=Carettochelys insculpta TaxID=44489 RepID=UPI003EBA3F72